MRRCSAVVLTAVLVLAAFPSAAAAAAWSPDRGFLVWTRQSESSAAVVRADRPGGQVTRLSRPPAGAADLTPQVSPDGSQVVFERDLPDGSTRLVVVRADGRGSERVVDTGCVDPCAVDVLPAWTPDGRHLTFSRVVGPFVDGNAASAVLYTADLDGRHVRRLSQPGIDGAFEDCRARYSPTGSFLVFVRVDNATGTTAVFRMGDDGRDVRQLTPWALSADHPEISPNRMGGTAGLIVFETHGGAHTEPIQDIATVPASCRPGRDCE
ncbi:TolB family protein [Amycolatopsis sp. NPDC098790]|uniref:TolB family protein n=1 Tax=Amycolatopsis sp. NPDC098790 TaxID=3363939 RepID=UPI0037FBFA82